MRRGTPDTIRSDNETTFKGDEQKLREALEQWNQDRLHDLCLQQMVDIQPTCCTPHGRYMGKDDKINEITCEYPFEE